MMGAALRWVLAVAAAAALSGCLDVEKLVHVRPDGSGYVEERMLMKRETLAMMQGMARMAAQSGDQGQPLLLDRERLAAAAAALGPDVTLASAEALSTPEAEGYVARYSFPDINRLTLDQTPQDPAAADAALPGTGPAHVGPGGLPGNGAPNRQRRETIAFELRKGDRPLLIVQSPNGDRPPLPALEEPKAPLGTPPEGPEREMALKMMQQMFQGMRVAVQVEVEGEIIETNASFRDGSRITLVDIRFDRILADPDRFERLVLAQPEGVAEVKALMQDLPGVKVEPNNRVEIRFAPR
jgi:hypothetical protein